MDLQKLFHKIYYELDYKKVGKDVDYCIFPDDDERRIFLAFQGTRSKIDILTDLNFPVKVYKHQESCIVAHGGFVKAWKSANDIIMNEFINACKKYSTYKPTIVGHSLGGAEACLASEDFHYRTKFHPDLITFGCPNVFFNKKSVKYVKSCCTYTSQYAQHNDGVTVLPFFYKQLNKIKVGEKFNLFKMIFHTPEYHTGYGKVKY